MNPACLPPLNDRRPNGTGHGAAATDESGSPRDLSPRSAATYLSPTSNRDLADTPITLKMADHAPHDDRMDGTEGSPELDQGYGPLLWGPWKAETPTPPKILAESVLQNVRGPLIVLDADFRVRL